MVFQAESFAIKSALVWLIARQSLSVKINIFIESLSGIQAIYAHHTKHKIILEMKGLLKTLSDKIIIAHISAHVDSLRNELADQEAKATALKTALDV